MVLSIPILHESFYFVLIFCLQKLKLLQVLLSEADSFICTQLNGFKYRNITFRILFKYTAFICIQLNGLFDTYS